MPWLALQAEDAGDKSGQVPTYITAAIISLGSAAAIRFVYGKLRHRPFWSPWFWGIAAIVSFLSIYGQVSDDLEQAKAESEKINAIAYENCMDGMAYQFEFDSVATWRRDFTRADFDLIATEYCTTAVARGVNNDTALQQEVANDLLRSGQITRQG